MRVLFVSGELIAGDVAYRLKEEGCEVKLFCDDPSRHDCFDGMLEKTKDWKAELDWVGKDGLIVFDDVGYGWEQDELRKQGFVVFGGSAGGDRLEKDREFCQRIFKDVGMEIEEIKDFHDPEEAIKYIEKNPAKWVVKQNSHDGALAYVGCMDDGRDVISVIHSYGKFNTNKALEKISLQKKVDGVEIAIGRFFNGQDWAGPICVNFEHKPFLNENLGPLTAEMGTLAWYDDNENNKLFQQTLAKMKSYLVEAGHIGYFDINTIVNENKITPLEATARFGSPTNHLQSEIHKTNWQEILSKTARGEKFELQHQDGISLVVSIAIPPFPYKPSLNDNSYYLKDVSILFKEEPTSEEWARIHFEEVAKKGDQYFVAGNNGYILFITGTGRDASAARRQAYDLVKKIVIPKTMYRTDIGLKFIENDQGLLKKWGWL
jgi:phosphoribosylamine--glycine ligase